MNDNNVDEKTSSSTVANIKALFEFKWNILYYNCHHYPLPSSGSTHEAKQIDKLAELFIAYWRLIYFQPTKFHSFNIQHIRCNILSNVCHSPEEDKCANIFQYFIVQYSNGIVYHSMTYTGTGSDSFVV